MKKILFALIATCSIWTAADAQILQGLGRKMKDKVQERINSKIDKAANASLEKVEDKISGKNKEATKNDNQPAMVTEKESLKSYSKFDFIAGEKIIYLDDFSKDPIGELPAKWNSNGKGEVIKVTKHRGNFLDYSQVRNISQPILRHLETILP